MSEDNAENARPILDLRESVGRDGARSRRVPPSEFGVTLRLLNSSLKYCARKGYVRFERIFARRYVHFSKCKSFAAKSRLAGQLLSSSLAFFRQGRAHCFKKLENTRSCSWKQAVLVGPSQLAEISTFCAACGPERVLAPSLPDLATSVPRAAA